MLKAVVTLLAIAITCAVPLPNKQAFAAERSSHTQRFAATPETVLIPAGTFVMGCASQDCDTNQKPAHKVRLSAFYMSKYETTTEQYRAFITQSNHKQDECFFNDTHIKGNWQNPRFMAKNIASDNDQPVVCVNWHDAAAYAKWLSQKTGQVWRLPTEAEWEYAAHAGATTRYSWGDNADCRKSHFGMGPHRHYTNGASFSCHLFLDNHYQKTRKVGRYQPNSFGLYDMHGNVEEWVADSFDKAYYKTTPLNNPQGGKPNHEKIARGGSWVSPPYSSTTRIVMSSLFNTYALGFRLVREVAR